VAGGGLFEDSQEDFLTRWRIATRQGIPMRKLGGLAMPDPALFWWSLLSVRTASASETLVGENAPEKVIQGKPVIRLKFPRLQNGLQPILFTKNELVVQDAYTLLFVKSHMVGGAKQQEKSFSCKPRAAFV
jgi:hypothetical protein